MNLSQLQGQFTALMNRRDFTANTSLQQTFINQAIMRIQRELRVPAMEKSVNVTISAPYTGLVIPSDMIELIDIIPAASNEKLRKCDISRALSLAQSTGTPEEYCRQGGVWVLGPSPVAADVIRIDYYAELPALVNSTDTNVIAIIAWDLIVYAALVQAAVYYKDARKDEFETQYQIIKGDLQDQADEDEQNSASEVMPCYQFPVDNQFDPMGWDYPAIIP
jgi:hypothetical protein